MKRILTFVLAFVMIASLSVSAFAIDGIPAYDGNYDADGGPGQNSGEINAAKHAAIDGGYAGDPIKDGTIFDIKGVKDGEIPVIDGVLSDSEGYGDLPDDYADYLYIGANAGSYTGPDFQIWYDEVKNMDLKMKYCWDGNYLYFYIEYDVSQYMNPAGSAADLWKWNCIQFGLAEADAVESAERSETLYGINSQSEMPMAGSVHGKYTPKAVKDYNGSIEKNASTGKTVVKHEFRVNVCEALGRTEPLKTGNVVKICVVIMCCNTGSSSGQRFISLGHGITGSQSSKQPAHFVNFTLSSGYDPNNQANYTPYYTPSADEIGVDYRDSVSFFFHQIKDSDDFAAENGTHVAATDENKYATFSTEDEMARFVSAVYPTGLWSMGDGIGSTYAVIRYRTTTEGMKLGLNFINNGMSADETKAEFDPEAVVYPIEDTPIVADGEWRDAIFKLSECGTYNGLMVSTGIEISAGSIDIDNIKFFGWDPCSIYGIGVEEFGCKCEECGDDCPCAGFCDESVCDCNCFVDTHEHKFVEGKCECGEKDPNYKAPTTGGNNGNTNVEKKEYGCKSSIAAGAALVVVASIASGAVLLKKKED